MKLVELHRHLDASLRLSTLLELAQKMGLEGESTSLARFREKFILSKPMKNLRSVLARFDLFQKVLMTPEILDRVAFEALEDCVREGLQKVELRFAPSFISEFSHLSWDLILAGVEKGIQRAQSQYPGIRVGLICIAVRESGVDGVGKTVEFFLQNRKHFVGFDLAGDEEGHSCKFFESAFAPLKGDPTISITIHAGEAAGPENVWEAIHDLGAKRIGHGIRSEEDPALMKYLKDHSICLEVCPTSNVITKAVSNIESHPLPRFLRYGIPVTINTDDPGIFGLTLPDEIQVCRDRLGMSEADINRCFDFADQLSFLNRGSDT